MESLRKFIEGRIAELEAKAERERADARAALASGRNSSGLGSALGSNKASLAAESLRKALADYDAGR